MLALLRYGVILSFIISIISLAILIIKTFSFGRSPLNAKPQGDVKRGILYAFGRGMMPWEKESARKHLLTYVAGILYHLGIFLALLYLFTLLFPIKLPVSFIYMFRIIFLVGFLCGFALLLKRWIAPTMRALSCPDDFISNIIVDIFLVLAFLHTFFSNLLPLFFLFAVFLFLYIPVGKIRHCVFFFVVRILFGHFYGFRGIVPPQKKVTFEK
jgi:hypothetical protein